MENEPQEVSCICSHVAHCFGWGVVSGHLFFRPLCLLPGLDLLRTPSVLVDSGGLSGYSRAALGRVGVAGVT